MIAFDTETHLFSPGNMAPKVVCLTWDNGNGPDICLAPDVAREFENMVSASDTFVAHNVAYDMACLYEHYPALRALIFALYQQGRVRCSLVREKLLDIAVGEHTTRKGRYALQGIAERHKIITDGFQWFDPPTEDKVALDKLIKADTPRAEWPWRYRYADLDGVPLAEWPEKAKQYALDDSVLCYALHASQEERATAEQYDFCDQDQQTRVAFAFQLADAWGVRTSAPHIKELADDLAARRDALRQGLLDIGLLKITGVRVKKQSKDMKVLMRMVEDRAKEIKFDLERTPTGRPKTDGNTLADLDLPEFTNYVEFARLEKLLSSFVGKLWAGVNAPIHSRTNVLVNTGRSSQSDINKQQLPRADGVRLCFVSRPGNVFISCDYDSQEMRTWAQCCLWITGESLLAQKYQADAGYDPHSELGGAYLMSDGRKLTYVEALAIKKSDPVMKAARQHAKPANFGFPGGMGPGGFIKYARGYDLKFTWDEAEKIKEGWRQQWPEHEDYFIFVANTVGRHRGTMVQFISLRVRGEVYYTEMANSLFQGLAADMSKDAMWHVTRECFVVPDSPLFGYRPWHFMHDEIFLEGPEGERAHHAAMRLQEVMMASGPKYCPDVPIRAASVISRHWVKGADPVFRDGMLIPWEDRPQ